MSSMSEEVKARLQEIGARKVKPTKLTTADWEIACDWFDEHYNATRGHTRETELAAMKQGAGLRAPSYLPPHALAVLSKRLPHVIVTLGAGPYKTRTVPAFRWTMLEFVYKFLGILGHHPRNPNQPKLATGYIRFRRGRKVEVIQPNPGG